MTDVRVLHCSNCQQELAVDPLLAGQLVSCSNCGNSIKLPPNIGVAVSCVEAAQDDPMDFLNAATGQRGTVGRRGNTSSYRARRKKGRPITPVLIAVAVAAVLLVAIIASVSTVGGLGGRNRLDRFLDDYEAIVAKWERVAHSRSLSIDDINEIGKLEIELAEKARQLRMLDEPSSSQLNRLLDLSTRLSKVVSQLPGASTRVSW